MLAEAHRGEIAGSPGRIVFRSDVNQALQERPGGQDHRVGLEDLADLRLHAAYGAPFDKQPFHACLAHPQVARGLQYALHPRTIGGLVSLSAARTDRRSLAGIEEAELDSGLVDSEAHLAAERVDLAHQMSLADSADRRVTGHLADVIQVEREHQRFRAHPGCGERGLDPGVAGADDDHVVFHRGGL